MESQKCPPVIKVIYISNAEAFASIYVSCTYVRVKYLGTSSLKNQILVSM